jgi:hypothetical protein
MDRVGAHCSDNRVAEPGLMSTWQMLHGQLIFQKGIVTSCIVSEGISVIEQHRDSASLGKRHDQERGWWGYAHDLMAANANTISLRIFKTAQERLRTPAMQPMEIMQYAQLERHGYLLPEFRNAHFPEPTQRNAS